MLFVGVVIIVMLRRRDDEVIRLTRCHDGIAVVVGQLSVVGYRVGAYCVVQFACRHFGITEGSYLVVTLVHRDFRRTEECLYERRVVCQATFLVFGSLLLQHVRTVQYGLSRQIGCCLAVIIDHRRDIIRYRWQQYGKLSRGRVGLDGDALHGIGAAVLTAYPRRAIHVFRIGLLVVQRILIAFVGAILAVECHIHSPRVLNRVARQQCQCRSTDVGIAAAYAYRLVLLAAATSHSSHHYGFRLVGECQTAD